MKIENLKPAEAAAPVLMHLKGRHNLGSREPKRWTKAMLKDDFFTMLKKFDQDYKCKVSIFQRNERAFLVLVMHEIGTVDKIIAREIQ